LALTLASSLEPLWARGPIQEGLNWLDAALSDQGPDGTDALAARVRATASRADMMTASTAAAGNAHAGAAVAAGEAAVSGFVDVTETSEASFERAYGPSWELLDTADARRR